MAIGPDDVRFQGKTGSSHDDQNDAKDPERTSQDAAILKSSARSQKFHGNFCLVPDRQLLLADYNFLLMIV